MDPEWPSLMGTLAGPPGLPVGGPALVRGWWWTAASGRWGPCEALRTWGQSPPTAPEGAPQGTKAVFSGRS